MDSWRVSTFHMDNMEAKTSSDGSGGQTLAAAFGLAMRDQHRVFAGDFNHGHHYVASKVPERRIMFLGWRDWELG